MNGTEISPDAFQQLVAEHGHAWRSKYRSILYYDTEDHFLESRNAFFVLRCFEGRRHQAVLKLALCDEVSEEIDTTVAAMITGGFWESDDLALLTLGAIGSFMAIMDEHRGSRKMFVTRQFSVEQRSWPDGPTVDVAREVLLDDATLLGETFWLKEKEK